MLVLENNHFLYCKHKVLGPPGLYGFMKDKRLCCECLNVGWHSINSSKDFHPKVAVDTKSTLLLSRVNVQRTLQASVRRTQGHLSHWKCWEAAGGKVLIFNHMLWTVELGRDTDSGDHCFTSLCLEGR